MRKPLQPGDLRGYARLAADATRGLADLVEAVHSNIAGAAGLYSGAGKGRTDGIAGLVYASVHGATRLVGGSIEALLGLLAPAFDTSGRKLTTSPEREAVLAALNGVLGDYLATSGNPLAITMRLRHAGQPLEMNTEAIRAALPGANGRLLVLAHGLCMNDLQWLREGHNHGAELARDSGFTPLYLHYNSGLHIDANGQAFAALLEDLVSHWPVPVESLTLLAHSMGGLVSQSACRHGAAAGHAWLKSLRNIVFLGTPHQGAPLERGGHWFDLILGATPYAAPFARLGKLRSAGITDLRHGGTPDAPAAWPKGVRGYAIAASTGAKGGDAMDRLLGDGLVPVKSALALGADGAATLFPKTRQCIVYEANHMDLLNHPKVYARIRDWLGK